MSNDSQKLFEETSQEINKYPDGLGWIKKTINGYYAKGKIDQAQQQKLLEQLHYKEHGKEEIDEELLEERKKLLSEWGLELDKYPPEILHEFCTREWEELERLKRVAETNTKKLFFYAIPIYVFVIRENTQMSLSEIFKPFIKALPKGNQECMVMFSNLGRMSYLIRTYKDEIFTELIFPTLKQEEEFAGDCFRIYNNIVDNNGMRTINDVKVITQLLLVDKEKSVMHEFLETINGLLATDAIRKPLSEEKHLISFFKITNNYTTDVYKKYCEETLQKKAA